MENTIKGYFTPEKIVQIAGILGTGGITVLPTDTIYGFHCASSDVEAIKKIGILKGKRARAGFILLAADIEMVDGMIANWPADSREQLVRIWPAPLTAILPAGRDIHSVLSPGGKVAIRVPAVDELTQIISLLGEAVVSTSINISGREPMTRINEIKRSFRSVTACISKQGRPGIVPSTIIDYTFRTPVVIREGKYRIR